MKIWKMIHRSTGLEIKLHDEQSVENLKNCFGSGWEHTWNLAPLNDTQVILKSVPRGKSERRKSSRHFSSLKVILTNGAKCLRAGIQDISEGGLQLQTRIPDEDNWENPQVFLSAPGGFNKIELPCRVVDGNNDRKRLEFRNKTTEQIKTLKEWIRKSTPQQSSVKPVQIGMIS